MEEYTQLCVWPGCIIGKDKATEFEEVMFKELGVRVKYEDEIITLPDLDKEGNAIAETGGRSDAFFYIHSEDLTKFAFPKFQVGIIWWEDIFYTKQTYMYPPEVIKKYPPKW